MSNFEITLDSIIRSAEVNKGHVLVCDDLTSTGVNELKNNKNKDKSKPSYDCAFIKIQYVDEFGKKNKYIKIKYSNIITSSKAKLAGNDIASTTNKAQICFMNMNRTDLECGDYVPKPKNLHTGSDLSETQIAENKVSVEKATKKNNKKLDLYLSNNKKFMKVLDILNKAYVHLCNTLISKEKTLDFKLKKDRKAASIVVHSFIQTNRVDEKGDDVKLENDIARIKVPIFRNSNKDLEKYNGQVGRYDYMSKNFKNIVYDIRKSTGKNDYKLVLAKVKHNGKLCNINSANIGTFITRKSLIAGTISIDSICASSAGLSLSWGFSEILVKRYNTIESHDSHDKSEVAKLRAGGDDDISGSDEDDDDITVEHDNEDNEDNDDYEDNTKKSKTSTKPVEENENENENVESDDNVEDSDE
jgi:hypothetical protein